MAGQEFPRALRLRRQADFERVFRLRCTAGDDRLVVFACPNDLPHARLGLSVSRRMGKAVVRNRWKRIIREAFRLSRLQLPAGVDLVVVPKPTAEPRLAEVMESLARLSRRLARRLEVNRR